MTQSEPGRSGPAAVAAVIPTFNARDHLRACLCTLGAQQRPPGRTIVVDDGSRDGTAEWLASERPDVVCLRGTGDWWWAESLNRGIRAALEAGSSHVWLLNDDNRPEPGSLEALLAASDAHPDCLICSLVVFEEDPGMIQFAGGERLTRFGGLSSRGGGVRDRGRYGPGFVDWCGGMGVLVPRGVFERAGLLDARAFPQYYGDADFCLRARRHGVRVYFEPASVVRNCGAKTGLRLDAEPVTARRLWQLLTARKSPYNVRRAARFSFRHSPWPYAVITLAGKYAVLARDLGRAGRAARAARRGRPT